MSEMDSSCCLNFNRQNMVVPPKPAKCIPVDADDWRRVKQAASDIPDPPSRLAGWAQTLGGSAIGAFTAFLAFGVDNGWIHGLTILFGLLTLVLVGFTVVCHRSDAGYKALVYTRSERVLQTMQDIERKFGDDLSHFT